MPHPGYQLQGQRAQQSCIYRNMWMIPSLNNCCWSKNLANGAKALIPDEAASPFLFQIACKGADWWLIFFQASARRLQTEGEQTERSATPVKVFPPISGVPVCVVNQSLPGHRWGGNPVYWNPTILHLYCCRCISYQGSSYYLPCPPSPTWNCQSQEIFWRGSLEGVNCKLSWVFGKGTG